MAIDRKTVEDWIKENQPSRTELREVRLQEMVHMFSKNLLLGLEDFEHMNIAVGLLRNMILELRNEKGIDILSVSRCKEFIGWILADEIL